MAGESYTSGLVHHAFLYSDGRMYDLNDLIDPALHITLWDATGINDRGQIVSKGVGLDGGRAFLLTPIPEPRTLALFGVALLGLGAWAHGVKKGHPPAWPFGQHPSGQQNSI